jgi:hypothetical protein
MSIRINSATPYFDTGIRSDVVDRHRSPAGPQRDRPGASDGIGRADAIRPGGSSDPLTFAGLAACIQEARAAASAKREPPPDPATFSALRGRLASAAEKLPAAYRRAVGEPLVKLLDRIGADGYARVLASDPGREGVAALLLDAAQATLQHGEGYAARATGAFQEVVSDLYDGFVDAERRKGVAPPDAGVLPPLVRWGRSETGPATWPVTATESLGVKAGVVSLPAANATGGLLAWPALAHETAGHDIVEADAGLAKELGRVVTQRLTAERMAPAIANYWGGRIDEVAADVLGVLNMGPAAAVGLIGYFRALNGAWRGTAALRNVGRAEDPHPADIARAYVAAETVRLLSFEGASRWADRLIAEADRDLGRIWLGASQLSAGLAKESAAAVAKAVVQTRLESLNGRALGEIQGWTDQDEATVAALRASMAAAGRAGVEGGATAGRYGAGAYAAHAVAAGIYEAVGGGTTPDAAMRGMIAVLDAMHARNPAWQAKPALRSAPGRASLGAFAA